MKRSKILAAIVVFAMVFSTAVVLERLDLGVIEQASALPGVDNWGYPTNVTTENLKYNADSKVNISVNTTGLTGGNFYYLYYPDYERSGSTYSLTWRPYMSGGAQKSIYVTTPGQTESLSNVYLNRSGLWVLNPTEESGVPDASNASNFASTVSKWFWVNSSETLTLTVSPDEVNYGNNETIQVRVKEDGAGVDSWVDVRVERNETEVSSFPQLANGGSLSFSSSWMTRLKYAGNYSVTAWRDLDEDTPLYQSYGYGYNSSFGSAAAINGSTRYNYAIAGPWDPPELNVSYYPNKLLCMPGEPTATVAEGNQTMYWSFDGEVNISVKDYDNNNITSLSVYVYNNNDANVTSYLNISQSGSGKWVEIETTTWGKNGSNGIIGGNGTWYAYIFKDVDGDRDSSSPLTHQYTEEWNTTVEWTVATAPSSQFKWIDDDSNISSDNNDGVIPRVPTISKQPVNIQFQIINKNHVYYGDAATADANAPAEKGENITVTGNAMFLSTKSLDELPGVSYSSGTWTLPLTPTMALNGGEIVIRCKWKGNGSVSETLNIGGPKLNGTIVTISPSEFIIDENVTLTVTVKDQGYAIPNAQIWLRYVSDTTGSLVNSSAGLIEYRNGGGTTTGEYEFLVNSSQQTYNQTLIGWTAKAPRNISAYVKYYRGGSPSWIYGYASAKMIPKSDFKVTVEPSTVMAGEKIKKVYFNTSIVDSSGNTTGWPKDTGLKVRIYNETGEDVTASIGSLSTSDTDGKANKTASNEYFQKPGTYTVHAYNNTHDSTGNNATFTIAPVDITSSISEFIWGVDDNISATFTVMYDGKPVNGSLRIDNMTELGTYNKTWTNCTFQPTIGSTSGSDTKNTSMEVDVENGAVTIFNITANNLSEYLSSSPGKWYHYSMKNISFFFKPDTSGSAWARAYGEVPVKIADVSASPGSLVYNSPAELELTVTGRGTGLGNVFTSIIIPGLSGEMNTTTSADGTATFAFTPPTTGEIAIKIENRTSSTVIPVRSWKLYLDVDTEADEGITFTATVRNGSASGGAVQDATVTFNRVSKTTDSSGQVTFDAPSVVATREFTMVAMKEGFAEDSETVYILNIPKLIIVVQGEVSAGATFDVIIADDTGNPVVGATITINEKTFTTGANGIATITAPSEEGTYTITATFPGYTDAEPYSITIPAGGIPGFELLTLLAALGVAFILLRRRRN